MTDSQVMSVFKCLPTLLFLPKVNKIKVPLFSRVMEQRGCLQSLHEGQAHSESQGGKPLSSPESCYEDRVPLTSP